MELSGKHLFGSIGEIRVTFIEKKIEQERLEFLKELLAFNGLEVITEELKRKTDEDPLLFNIGVTDMTFNPTIWIFQRKLKALDGKHWVTLEYWKQLSKSTNPAYWKND